MIQPFNHSTIPKYFPDQIAPQNLPVTPLPSLITTSTANEEIAYRSPGVFLCGKKKIPVSVSPI